LTGISSVLPARVSQRAKCDTPAAATSSGDGVQIGS
jgi:hypothetical protein